MWLEFVRSVWFGLVQLTSEGKSEHKVTNFFLFGLQAR